MEVVERPSLAQIFRRFYLRYRQEHGVTGEQRKAAWCIQACRTPALGGRKYQCQKCGKEHRVYHSCRNRHCPVCQLRESYRWLEAQEARLLPVSYFHVVFTLASELHTVFRYNRQRLYGLLMSTAAEVLQRFGQDPQWLGARTGFVGLLHTWGQQMVFHPHAHFIVPQGGIDARGRWVWPKKKLDGKFLFPVVAVSQVFQGTLLARLEKLWISKELEFPDEQSQSRFGDTLRLAASKAWEVYAQRPFAGPQAILKYLGKYTHRVAISEQRLVSMDAQGVQIEYKDYRQGGQKRKLQLSGTDFVGRFLEHVLPRGFRKIRQYGFLGNRSGRDALQELQAQWLARLGAVLGALAQWPEKLEALAGEQEPWVRRCPACGEGELRWSGELGRVRVDSS